MPALALETLTWPEVASERDGGRDTVVVAFGATEQHGRHLPLGTDALIGDELARRVADRLEAFVAPTVRVGCSSHHLAFGGTLSLADVTFHAIVADLVGSLARGGFRRAVLIPTHGGNFGPLAAAIEALGPEPGIEVRALTDLGALGDIIQVGATEHGVAPGAGGLHAGEWETSLLLAARPDLVRMDRAEAGFTGDPGHAAEVIFTGGIEQLAENGVIGDPAEATVEHGERYWAFLVERVLRELGEG